MDSLTLYLFGLYSSYVAEHFGGIGYNFKYFIAKFPLAPFPISLKGLITFSNDKDDDKNNDKLALRSLRNIYQIPPKKKALSPASDLSSERQNPRRHN